MTCEDCGDEFDVDKYAAKRVREWVDRQRMVGNLDANDVAMFERLIEDLR